MVQKDIIVNTVGKEGQLGRYITRGKIKSQVGLQTVFRFEAFVADFIAQRPLMFTIRAQFTQIRRTEPTGKIHAQVKVLVDVADSTYTTCESAEIA